MEVAVVGGFICGGLWGLVKQADCSGQETVSVA